MPLMKAVYYVMGSCNCIQEQHFLGLFRLRSFVDHQMNYTEQIAERI